MHKGKIVSAWIDVPSYERLAEMAKADDRRIAWFVKQAIKEYLKSQEEHEEE
jgi:predicted transcriptional regulator